MAKVRNIGFRLCLVLIVISAIIGFMLHCVGPVDIVYPEDAEADTAFSTLPCPVPPPSTDEILKYRFGCNGLPGADFRIRTRVEEIAGQDIISILFSGTTLNTVNWAWRYRLDGMTYLDRKSRLPIFSARVSTENGETEMNTLDYDRAQSTVRSVEQEFYDEMDTSEETLPFRQGLDFAAALWYLREFEWQTDQTFRIEVVEDEAHVIRLTRVGTQKIATPAGEFEAIEVNVDIRPAAETSQKKEKNDKTYSGGRIWLSRDERHLPLKLQADIFVGWVYAELIDVQYPGHGQPVR